MSGVVRSVGKIFKKVVRTIKKVAPVVLAAAAIYFTVGAALGVAGTAGGWGGAASGLVGKLGLGSTLGGIVTGAVTQAGYGAVIGGAFAAATGDDVSRGLLRGATVGAVTGGVLGGLGLPTDPFEGIGEAPATAASSAVTGGGRAGGVGTPGVGGGFDGIVARTGGGTGLLSKIGAFVEKNPVASGLAIQGLGTGISGFAQASAQTEAAELLAQQKKDEANRIAGNFDVGGGGGLLTGSGMLTDPTLDTTARPTPAQQFNPVTVLAKSRGAMWRYNPETGQIELTPAA
jgi:hypothetical protein